MRPTMRSAIILDELISGVGFLIGTYHKFNLCSAG